MLKKTKWKGSVSIREGKQRATGSGQALVPSDLLPPARLHLLVPEQCQVVTKTLAHEPTGSFQTTNARQSLLFSQRVTHALTAFSKGEDLLLLCLWHFCHNLQFPDSVFSFFLGFYLFFFFGGGGEVGIFLTFFQLWVSVSTCWFRSWNFLLVILFDTFTFVSGTLSRWLIHFQSSSLLS